jgi:predicted permease
MHRFAQELRHAARGLLRSPVFTVGVIVTLALGIGINATMFGVVDALFVRTPAGVTNAGQIVRVYYRQTFPGMGTFTGSTTSYPAFTAMRDRVPGFAQAAAIWMGQTGLGRGADAIRVRTAVVSHQYFPMAGVQPARGRFFTATEDRPGGEHVAVLTYGFWQRHFGGDPAIVGRSLTLGKSVYTVIGVGPAAFNGVEINGAELFLPIAVAGNEVMGRQVLDNRGWVWLHVVARLRPDLSRAAIVAQATAAFRQHNSTRRPDSTSQVVLGPIQEARGPAAPDDARVSAWIGAVSLIVLLIACANIANLLLARGMKRQREFAVRASLGAGRGGLILMVLMESLLLAIGGGVIALLFAMWGGVAARSFLLPSLGGDVPLVDGRVLMVAGIGIAVTALLIGLVPAIQATRTDLVAALKSGGRGSTTRHGHTSSALLVAQVALTMALLVGAGLFVRSLRNAQAVDLGLDVDRIVTMSIDFDAGGFSQPEATAAWLQVLDRVQRLPGVEHAAISMGTPFFGWTYSERIRVEGRDSLPTFKSGPPYYQIVSPDYMATTGTRILAGRGFTAGDVPGAGDVAIVGATFAKRVWPRETAIGKCLYVGDSTATCRRIVGVAADTKSSISESDALLYYLPFAQADKPHVNAMFVRVRGNTSPMIAALRREVQAMGSLPHAAIEPMADKVAPDLRSWRLGSAAFSAFGLLALVIAATGIFAVLSYTVSQRTQEIGVRVALGAQSHQVVEMVVAQALRITAIGIAVGTAGAFALGRSIASLLYGVPSADVAVFTSTMIVLLIVAGGAAWVPAMRASRVAPMIALRSE